MDKKYWEYFLSIESDLNNCRQYVDFNEANYATFSNEFARIIMVASAEIDTIFKDLCNTISEQEKPNNILKYHPIIFQKYPKISEFIIEIPRYKLSVTPWSQWDKKNSPDWWKDGYNQIKHNRTKHYSQANLKNAINSVAGLFTLILYYHDAISGDGLRVEHSLTPLLFRPKTDSKGGIFWYCKPLK